MTADTRKPFERAVTDIASRQPALNPTRHVPGELASVYRDQVRRIVELEGARDELAAALLDLLNTPTHNTRAYARALLAKLNAQP